jgi:undecaprenyl pyrophosphate phosphatase UppP
MNTLQAIVLAIEGITEFLPVSSTGHMIIASSFFGIASDDFTKLFTIVIQLGQFSRLLFYISNVSFRLGISILNCLLLLFLQ